MIGLDTNVIVRYFTQDDRIQSRRASHILERLITPDNPGFVSVVTAAETVWVLERAYAFSDSAIAAAMEAMLQTDALYVECEDAVFAATVALKAGHGFADALIGALGKRAGCAHTLTFDKRASRLPGFILA